MENEDFVPGTPFLENPSQPPNFAHLCGQCGIGTWYLYIVIDIAITARKKRDPLNVENEEFSTGNTFSVREMWKTWIS